MAPIWQTTVLLLVTLGILVNASVVMTCPQGCVCNAQKQEMICSALDILPNYAPPAMLSFKCLGCRLWALRARDFDGMRHLKKLYLPSAGIATIEPFTFNTLQNLEILDLFGNNLKTLDATSFSGLNNLKQLILHSCGIEDIINVFDPLPGLEYLILHSNRLKAIPSNVFSNMATLKSMRLDWNLIEEIHPYSFMGLSSLKDLNLLANKIHTLHSSAFEGLGSLKQIYIGRNQLTSFDPNIFNPLTSLEHLNFFQNKISYFQTLQFGNLPNVREIVAHNNGLMGIGDSAFAGVPTLKTLHLSNNVLKRITKNMLVGLDNLETLDLVNNGLEVIDQDAFQPLRELRMFSLWNNPKLNIKDGTLFNSLRKLKKIYMQDIGLTQVPANLDLPDLDQIELGRNSIAVLPKDLGLSTSLNLRYVGLDRNKIKEINLSHLGNFQFIENLRLYNNKIVSFDESLRPIFANKLKHVRIDGNPIHCNCEVSWLTKITHSKFYGRQGGYNLRCATPHSKYLLRETSDADFQCVKPRFIADKTHLKGGDTKDTNVVLTCTAYGDPAPKITWYVVSKVDSGPPIRTLYKDDKKPQKHGSYENVDTLTLQRKSAKEMICVATNRAGTVEKKFSL